MSFKIPCGGFRLDENSFSLDENGVLSIPEPLTPDYIPSDYPNEARVTEMINTALGVIENGSY